jgi:transketolase
MWAGSVRGPQAPPGQYQVRLTAAGTTKTQSFSIVRNPRISSTDADLQQQFALARDINAKVSATNQAVVKIRNVKEQVSERTTKANDAKIKAAADALAAKLTDVEGMLYQYKNRSSQDPLNFPIRLNNKLAALQGIVESGDYRPTDQSYAVFKELTSQLETHLGRLDVLLRSDVDAFNKLIVRKKLPPVVAK